MGVRAGTEYRSVVVGLGPGDYIVIYSDGFAEAANGDGDVFGFARTVDTVCAACRRGLSPDEVIDHVTAAVRSFSGDVAQSDDMTCVVLKITG